MIDFEYLYKGICGLANAHHAGTMAGHLGAAVVAGYFVGEELNYLPDVAVKGVQGELDRVIQGEEAIWFNAAKIGITPTDLFKPFPEEQAQSGSIKSIAAALEANVDKLRQSGHNVIFTSIAVRALHDHTNYATPSITTGIQKLIEGFNHAHAGRGYFGKEKGWLNGNQVNLPDDDSFPPYRDVRQMVEVTVSELIATAAVKKQGFGGLWHVINHAAAITELDRFGYKHIAQQALPAHHRHIRLWRSLPDVGHELGAVVKSKHDPCQPEYWQATLRRDQARLTHRIKTIYGFFTLKRFIERDDIKQQAEDAFLNLMA